MTGNWSRATYEEIAAVLADSKDGLTGREIGVLLATLRMDDPTPDAAKRDRLTEAFIARHNHDRGDPKRIITFITRVMEPVKYRDRPELFTVRQDRLNERLAFVGLHLNDRGQVARGERAATLDEATRIATSVRDELRRRRVHDEVLRYCSIEVLKKAHFHASLEATKSIFDRLRSMTGVTGDGATLVDNTLALGKTGMPRVAINMLSTQTEKDEQTGLVNLLKGLNGMFRNPVAHDARLNRAFGEEELLEVLNVVSMVHRRLDAARLT